jgi:hypothetical protein
MYKQWRIHRFSLSVKVAVRAISTSFHAIRQESTLLLRITNLEFLFIRAQGTYRDVDLVLDEQAMAIPRLFLARALAQFQQLFICFSA